MKNNYQYNYSSLHGQRTLNKEKRLQKASQILTIIEDYNKRYLKSDIKKWSVLDIGCSSGMVDFYLANYFMRILGIDIDACAIELANAEYLKSNIEYRQANIDEINICEKYDLIICNSVLEHVPYQKKLLESIDKLLKPKGICFLSVPNKFTIAKEPHYDLLFLSWFPKSISNLYLRILKKGNYYYETPPSYNRLLNMCNIFRIFDYTIERIKFPKKYNVEFRIKDRSLITKLPTSFLNLLKFVSPSFVFVLQKLNDC